jgi:hypothetical protein
MAAPGEHARSSAIASHDQPVTVVFDFVCPLRAGRRLGSETGEARLNEPGGKNATIWHRL